MSGGAWDEIKKPHYKIISGVSDVAEDIGEKWNWDFQAEEGKKNKENPGRAITKAAPYVIGGLFSAAGGAGGAAGSAAEVAGEEAAKQAATTAAEELAKQEALNAAQYAMQQGMLESGGLMSGMAGTSGQMESALMDTGYTPSSLFNAARYGPGSGQSMGKTLGNWASNKAANAAMSAKNGGLNNQMAARMGMQMLNQPAQAPQPQRPPPPAQPMPYMQMYGMSEEEKQRLRMMGYMV